MDGQLDKILINNKFYETRVAYIKDNSLFYYFNENKSEISIVGNIYKGKVARVLPGLQSAFVDIGQDKAAFLHVSDLMYQHITRDDIDKPISSDTDILDIISEKDELLIQVTKDPISTKGPRVVTMVSIPGRFLVFFPIGNKVGISKKIESDAERTRLKRIIENYKPKDTAFIARTAAEGVSEEMLENDMRICMQQWINIVKKHKKSKGAVLLYEDLILPLKITRDMLNNSVSELIIDDRNIYDKVISFVEEFMPSQKSKVKFYDNQRVSLFKKYNLDSKIDKLNNKSAQLKSGGNIIIEQVEALTVVDVNTGSFVGKNLQHDDTILQTNKEAMDAVAEQIRLRNIGGIIIVDFIDMKSDADKEILIKYAEKTTKHDRANVTIHGITRLGLMQITRKRISDSLRRNSTSSCKVCNGRGYVKSDEAITHEIYQKITEMDKNYLNHKTIEIFANDLLLNYIKKNERNNITKLSEQFNFDKVIFTKRDTLETGKFDIIVKAKKSHTETEKVKEIKIKPVEKQDIVKVLRQAQQPIENIVKIAEKEDEENEKNIEIPKPVEVLETIDVVEVIETVEKKPKKVVKKAVKKTVKKVSKPKAVKKETVKTKAKKTTTKKVVVKKTVKKKEKETVSKGE